MDKRERETLSITNKKERKEGRKEEQYNNIITEHVQPRHAPLLERLDEAIRHPSVFQSRTVQLHSRLDHVEGIPIK
jgi:hypothetical protein